MSAVVLGEAMWTALGRTEDTWRRLLRRETGIRRIRRFDASTFPVTFGAEIGDVGLDGPALYYYLLDAVCDEAFGTLDFGAVPAERIGVFFGSEAVRPDLGELARRWQSREAPRLEELERHHPAGPAVAVAKRLGAKGPVVTLSIACTSSAQAVGEALWAIRRGEVDVAVAGGVDVLVHPLMVLGFSRLGALSVRNDEPDRASRPFDRDRDGFVLGDGAGVVVLASPKVAGRLGRSLGKITGYASSCNAWRITDTPPDGRGTRTAMEEALRDAGCSPSRLAYINAHGTSTQQNDASEAAGMRAALGDLAMKVPVSSTKSLMGHTVAACGVIEALLALRTVRDGIAPPTANLEQVDPECALFHVVEPLTVDKGVALSNAAGFGGSNTTIVVEAP